MEHTSSAAPDENEKSGSPHPNEPKGSHGSRSTNAPIKPASSNALKFGFFSPKALLPGESWDEFVTFYQEVLQQLCPRNRWEEHLVQEYVPLAWRIKRFPEIEAAVFTRYGISVQGNQCGPALAMVASVQSDNILGQLARYEGTLRKSAFKYLDELRALRKNGPGADAAPVINIPS